MIRATSADGIPTALSIRNSPSPRRRIQPLRNVHFLVGQLQTTVQRLSRTIVPAAVATIAALGMPMAQPPLRPWAHPHGGGSLTGPTGPGSTTNQDGLAGADPLQFSASELQELERRFGVHGPQTRLAQLFSQGIDQFQPLRSHALNRLEELRPLILSQCARRRVNPLLVTAVLFDEMRHAKPGENHPLAAHSGLFSTHGLAQLGVGEMVHQGMLPSQPSPAQVSWARDQLLDPHQNVALLVGKFARLKRALDLPSERMLEASGNPRDAKALATLAYLHNGKLDYPRRILASMQDPELHALIYGQRKPLLSPLI